MKVVSALALCVLIHFAFASSGEAQQMDNEPLVIVTNGVAQAVINLVANPSPVEKFAAHELQKYFRNISGAEIQISPSAPPQTSRCRIILGTPESNEAISKLQADGKLAPFTEEHTGFDGFVVKRLTSNKQNIVVLAGNQPRAVLFAAYDFLERLGVRFFGFGEGGENVPRQPTIRIGKIDHFEKPRFKYRIVNNNNFVSTNKQMLVQITDWAVKNRFNAFLLTLDDVEHVATDELLKRGMEIWGGGHVWGELTPGKNLFKTHPEYFPLIDGKRQFPGDKSAISFATPIRNR